MGGSGVDEILILEEVVVAQVNNFDTAERGLAADSLLNYFALEWRNSRSLQNFYKRERGLDISGRRFGVLECFALTYGYIGSQQSLYIIQ